MISDFFISAETGAPLECRDGQSGGVATDERFDFLRFKVGFTRMEKFRVRQFCEGEWIEERGEGPVFTVLGFGYTADAAWKMAGRSAR